MNAFSANVMFSKYDIPITQLNAGPDCLDESVSYKSKFRHLCYYLVVTLLSFVILSVSLVFGKV